MNEHGFYMVENAGERETERERASCKYTFSPLHIFILTIAMIAQWVCMNVV